MFEIDVLPAQRGDCLWLTYGTSRERHHVLIDAGPQETIPTLVPALESRIAALPGDEDRVELLVVSHVDADHVQGVVSLLSDPARVPFFGDVWFNGYQHLTPHPKLGGPDGERLTASLLHHEDRWNAAFGGAAVVVPDEGPLPQVTLPGGLTITLLSPTRAALERLLPEWEETCERAGILPGAGAPIVKPSWRRTVPLLGVDWSALAAARYSPDRSAANATSIAFVAEYDGKRALLLADATTGELVPGLRRLGEGPHEFDVVKLSHHASRRNTNPELVSLVRSPHWIVSTNGAQFCHPDPECLARVVETQDRPTFHLNYATSECRSGAPFLDDLLSHAGSRYSVALPGDATAGITVSL